jgi:hypothetical protein
MNTRIIIYLLLLFYPFFSKGQNNINDTLYSFILKPKSQANGLDSVFLGTFSMTACKGEQTNYLFPPTMINNGQMIYNIYDKLMYSATFGKFDNTVYILRYDMAKKTIVDTIFSEPSLLTKGVIYQITFDNKGGLFFTRAFGYDLYKLELSTKKAILIGNRGKVGQDYAFKYFKGKFYFAEQSRGIVSADPDDFLNSQKTVISAAVLKNQGANIGAYDLLIPSGYCDSSALYLYSSHPVYGGMYRLDLDNNNIIKECSLPIGIGGIERSMNGFFTKKEVLAADCKLTIDLDLDDSTGKPKISYKSTNCIYQLRTKTFM